MSTSILQTLPFEKTLEIEDKEGRYVPVSGKIESTRLTILNVYIPPGVDISISRKIFDLMSEATDILIYRGDWNMQINPRLCSSKMFTQTPVHKKMKFFMSERGVVDLWRDFHPTEWNYTHYPHPHDAYSRINYYLIHKRDRRGVHQCELGNIDLSDHAPVRLTIQINNSPGNTLSRLNPSILNNTQFQTQLK